MVTPEESLREPRLSELCTGASVLEAVCSGTAECDAEPTVIGTPAGDGERVVGLRGARGEAWRLGVEMGEARCLGVEMGEAWWSGATLGVEDPLGR